MFGMGMGELIVIFIVALIVLGPQRLPKLAQDLGKAIREFRKAADDVKQELTADDDLRKPFQELHEAVTLPPEELKRREEERKRAVEAAAQAAESKPREAPEGGALAAGAPVAPAAPELPPDSTDKKPS